LTVVHHPLLIAVTIHYQLSTINYQLSTITYFPMSLSALLDQSLSLQRQTITADASGAAVRTFATILTGVPCAAGPAGAAVVADYARRDMIVTYHVYTTADLDALASGGAQLGDRFTDGTRYYLVKAVLKSANSLVSADPLYQLDCELID